MLTQNGEETSNAGIHTFQTDRTGWEFTKGWGWWWHGTGRIRRGESCRRKKGIIDEWKDGVEMGFR